MKTVATILAAIFGAVAGLIVGFYLAFLFGLHEKPHFLGLAFSVAVVAALASVSITSRSIPATHLGKGALLFTLLISAGVFVVWFLHIIQVL